MTSHYVVIIVGCQLALVVLPLCNHGNSFGGNNGCDSRMRVMEKRVVAAVVLGKKERNSRMDLNSFAG